MSERVYSDSGPFSIVPEWLLNAEVSDRAVRLYGVLGRYADSEGRCYPGRKTLAERLRCSAESVDRAIRELKNVGAVDVQRRPNTSNEYVIRRVPESAATRLGVVTPDDSGGRVGDDLTRTTSNENQERESSETSSPRPKKKRARNLVWDAICEVVGWEPKTDREIGRVARAQKAIRAAVPADADDETIAMAIRGRARRYREAWPGKELSPDSLVNHWSRFGPKRHDPDGRAERTRAERQADPAMTTEAWAESAISPEARAEAKRRAEWHARTRAEAEASGGKWVATDPPDGWTPTDGPESTVGDPESSDQGGGGGPAAEGAA